MPCWSFWKQMGTSRAAFLRFSYNLSAKVRKVEDERMGFPSAIFAIVDYGRRELRLHHFLPLAIVVAIAWYTRLTHLHHIVSCMHIPPTFETPERQRISCWWKPKPALLVLLPLPFEVLPNSTRSYHSWPQKTLRVPKTETLQTTQRWSCWEYPKRYNSFKITYPNVDECVLVK